MIKRIIGLGLCRPETYVYGMPGWSATSWGYDGDDGRKFHDPEGMGSRYANTYGVNDTIGCGLNMETGKLFFTKNGDYLGK